MTTAALRFLCLVAAFSACGDDVRSDPRAPRPLLDVRMDTPTYLASSVKPDAQVSVTLLAFDTARASLEMARQRLIGEIAIESYPAQTIVPGNWSYMESGISLTFEPSAPLPEGDVVVRFPNASSDLVVHPRPYNVFHVGSVKRLAQVLLRADKPGQSKELVLVEVRFSEMPGAPFQFDVSEEIGASWTPIPMTLDAPTAARLARPVDIQRRIRVSVAAADLDGQWTGSPGSGPAVAEFLPKDYETEPGQVDFPIVPDLKITLPGGIKKP